MPAVLAAELEAGGVRIVSGGTDNHLMLVDLTNLGATGKDAESWLDEASITVNKNGIPFDKKSPFITSGVRIGTPAVTSRGMKEKEMKLIAQYVTEVLKSGGEKNKIDEIQKKVQSLCGDFPIYN